MYGLCVIIFHKINGCIKDYDQSKFLTFITGEEKNKGLLTKHDQIFDKVNILWKQEIMIQIIMVTNT